jgi:hypothetical protein
MTRDFKNLSLIIDLNNYNLIDIVCKFNLSILKENLSSKYINNKIGVIDLETYLDNRHIFYSEGYITKILSNKNNTINNY